EVDLAADRQGRGRLVLGPQLVIVVAAPAVDFVGTEGLLTQQRDPGAAPLQLPAGDVLLEGDGRLAGADPRDGADLARGRVGDLGVVPGVSEAELAAREADLVGRDGDVQHQLMQRAVADVAHGGVTALKGDDVDGVRDFVVAQTDADDPFAPEALLEGQFADPAGFGLQIDVAAEDVLVLQVGRGGEVAEVQLADRALDAQAHLGGGRRRPGRQQARLGVEEALLLLGVARLADGRGFQPQAALERPFGIDAPGGLAEQFAARLLDLDRGRGQGLVHPADRIGLIDLQHVVGDLAAAFELQGGGPLEAQQAAQDGLGGVAVGGEPFDRLFDPGFAVQGGGDVVEFLELVDEARLQLQPLRQGAGVDDADLAALGVFVGQAFAQHVRRGLAIDAVPVVDPVTRRQVDPAAHQRAGVGAPDRVPAAVAVV